MDIVNDKELFILQAKSLISGEHNLFANLSNLSALYKEYIDNINWIGFYLVDEENNNLVLGPFQGKVACIRIPFNKGVCGHCYTSKETVYVENVHKFPGHIACDSATNSELVVPILQNNKIVALLDIDSISFSRFSNKEINVITEVTTQIFSELNFFHNK
ncbi:MULTISPECIES: GAF domain-containing protein [unclassified Gemella]|uniref:GAF domain-containing protein n=1 Tax=unclassified Gemella TaxID=2624949 RepID=UPI0010733827|nr:MULTISPECIES: GAF domain-containing protein [unclassified Gemella]MBF0709998.1 GAF domain-containing protein [Gemella sp. GL1.1]MBF0746253.1 GAF domain-containing protein [Gemella sp. 19428wG2_WT2a]NYS27342.1 GAF domain-containing protein [Gemella sp. GL1]TFU60533.1 GAF domain-containing protein [Gemella sp. WT2a]